MPLLCQDAAACESVCVLGDEWKSWVAWLVSGSEKVSCKIILWAPLWLNCLLFDRCIYVVGCNTFFNDHAAIKSQPPLPPLFPLLPACRPTYSLNSQFCCHTKSSTSSFQPVCTPVSVCLPATVRLPFYVFLEVETGAAEINLLCAFCLFLLLSV